MTKALFRTKAWAAALLLAFLCPAHVLSVDLATYYSRANMKKKSALKTALYEIIGQADVLGYGSGQGATWYGFYQTDRMENNQVRDRYSYETFYFNTSNPYTAVSGMNIEHSFPKSWWGGSKNQAYQDIHHLMPSEQKINSSKSNYGMGKVTSIKTDNGCTRVGTGPGPSGQNISLWEPADEWKGDFARCVFYIVTCYQNLTWQGTQALLTMENNDWPTLQPWAYQLYLQWAKADPVDDIERARNEAVYAIQGNRNPFIDYPTLPEYIWGDSIAYAFDVSLPHTWDGSNPDTPPTPPNPTDSVSLIAQTFTEGMGDFTTVTVDGSQSQIWTQSAAYGAVANAYSYGRSGDEWLISPTIDLTSMQGAALEFTHATGYNTAGDASEMFEVVVASDYEQRPSDAEWIYLPVEWPARPASGFTRFVPSGSINLDDYAGEKINIAFHYKATSAKCWAWEIKTVTLKAKPLPDGIDQNYLSPIPAEDAVFDLHGHYLGREVPSQRGIYIVRQGGYTFKRFVR